MNTDVTKPNTDVTKKIFYPKKHGIGLTTEACSYSREVTGSLMQPTAGRCCPLGMANGKQEGQPAPLFLLD
jgi:hypothetical protein